MTSHRSVTERLRDSLKRTRERLGFVPSEEEPDWDALEEALVLADVGIPTTQRILEGLSEFFESVANRRLAHTQPVGCPRYGCLFQNRYKRGQGVTIKR